MTPFSFAAGLVSAALALPPSSEAPAARPSVENVYWMADCLIQQTPREAGQVLATVPGESGSTMALLHAAIGPCLVAEHPLAGPDLYLRGAIAERLLARDFPTEGTTPGHRPATVFAPLRQDRLGRAGAHSLRLLAALDMTSCVARREPDKVHAFFRTARTSPAEHVAMVELAPAISACLVEGQTFDMAPPLFRAFLAEGAYRVAAGQPSVYEISP